MHLEMTSSRALMRIDLLFASLLRCVRSSKHVGRSLTTIVCFDGKTEA